MPKEFRFKGEYIVKTNSYEVDGSLSFRKSVKFSPYVQVLERQRRIRYVTIRIRISLFILIRIWSWISTGLSSNGNFFLHKIQTCPLIHPDCKILGWTGSMLFNHPVPRIYSSDYAARISDPDPAQWAVTDTLQLTIITATIFDVVEEPLVRAGRLHPFCGPRHFCTHRH